MSCCAVELLLGRVILIKDVVFLLLGGCEFDGPLVLAIFLLLKSSHSQVVDLIQDLLLVLKDRVKFFVRGRRVRNALLMRGLTLDDRELNCVTVFGSGKCRDVIACNWRK